MDSLCKGYRDRGEGESFIGKIMFLSLLTRKRYIFHMLFTKQKIDFRVTFSRLERAPSRRVRVTSLGNLGNAIFPVARCYRIGV